MIDSDCTSTVYSARCHLGFALFGLQEAIFGDFTRAAMLFYHSFSIRHTELRMQHQQDIYFPILGCHRFHLLICRLLSSVSRCVSFVQSENIVSPNNAGYLSPFSSQLMLRTQITRAVLGLDAQQV